MIITGSQYKHVPTSYILLRRIIKNTFLSNKQFSCVSKDVLSKTGVANKHPDMKRHSVTLGANNKFVFTAADITTLNVVPHRYYSKKHKDKSGAVSSDEEEEENNFIDDIIDKQDKGTKIVSARIPSLRVDLVLKSGLGVSRNKVDLAFYESRLRLNGQRVLKKSQRVNIDDEIDVVKGHSKLNPDFLLVSRIQIISAKPDEEELHVRIRRTKSLQIENYDDAPYVETSSV